MSGLVRGLARGNDQRGTKRFTPLPLHFALASCFRPFVFPRLTIEEIYQNIWEPVNSLDDVLLAIDIVNVQWNRRFLEAYTFRNSFNSFNSNQKLFCLLCQTLHCYPRFFSDFQSRTNFRSSWRSEKSGSHCNHGIIELQCDAAKIPGSHLQHNDITTERKDQFFLLL